MDPPKYPGGPELKLPWELRMVLGKVCRVCSGLQPRGYSLLAMDLAFLIFLPRNTPKQKHAQHNDQYWEVLGRKIKLGPGLQVCGCVRVASGWRWLLNRDLPSRLPEGGGDRGRSGPSRKLWVRQAVQESRMPAGARACGPSGHGKELRLYSKCDGEPVDGRMRQSEQVWKAALPVPGREAEHREWQEPRGPVGTPRGWLPEEKMPQDQGGEGARKGAGPEV